MSWRRNVRRLVPGAGSLIWLSLFVFPFGFPTPALAQPPQPQTAQPEVIHEFDAQEIGASASEPDRQSSGYISGTVLDKSGTVALGAQVRLTRNDQSPTQQVLSGNNGEFSFSNLPPGPFQVTIAAEGFETQRVSGALRPGQAYLVPAITLPVATVVTEVRVGGHADSKWRRNRSRSKRSNGCSASFQIFCQLRPQCSSPRSQAKVRACLEIDVDPFTFVASWRPCGSSAGEK